MAKVHWHREPTEDGTPKWYAEQNVGTDPISGKARLTRVAEAAQTGRPGVDDYPWDWFLTDAGQERAYNLLPARSMAKLKTVGVADTLRAVKENVEHLLNLRDE